MIDIRERLLAAFQVEYREHLEIIRKFLEEFDARPEAIAIANLDEIFRRAHSLKGAARAVDLMGVEKLAHKMETLFARLRSGQVKTDGAVMAAVGAALDAIEDMVGAFVEGTPLPDVDQAMVPLARLLGEVEGRPAEVAPIPVPVPAAAPRILPSPAAAPSPSPSHATAVKVEETVRVRARHLDRLMRSSNELLTETMNQRRVTEGLVDIDGGLADIEKHWRRMRKTMGQMIRSLDDGDFGTAFSRQAEVFEQMIRGAARKGRQLRRQQQRVGWTLRQLGEELQAEVRQVRMVPAESVFDGFRKMVRDIARDAGKVVDVHVAGLEVEADRMVLQGLKDPVMHLLRNALAHGLEMPADRVSAGKPSSGRLELRFALADGRLLVAVEDDGRGLNLSAIRHKAVERGLFSDVEAEALSREALLDLIFDPGFSTAKEVDNLAGRGMGLSVVREAAAMMNGTVRGEDRPPCGTRFVISVPLSVSSQRLFLVSCQGHVYALPTEGIDRLHRVPAEMVKTVEGKSVVYLGDGQVPLLSLAHLLGLGETAVTVSRNVVPLAVLRNGDRRVGVAVDEFIAIREGLVRDIGVPAARGTMVAGGLLLEDGAVALVLNPFEIVEIFRKSGTTRVLTTVEKPAERRVPVILVVDDSLTTRTLEKSILEAQGYVVRLAVDGIEALSRLRAENIDLVVSDIQMPRLDGFGLLQAIKADSALKSIPLVLVSSLEAREDRERGLALGADAYVIKGKFDQKELLETIGQFL